MSQILSTSNRSGDLAGRLVFVATAARLPVAGAPGVRSAMARAAQLLQLDPPSPMTARHDATPAPAGSLRPARRRTRRYAERFSS